MWDAVTEVDTHKNVCCTNTCSQRKQPPHTPINKSDDNNHPVTDSYERSRPADLWASISALHFHPHLSSLELSAQLRVSLLLRRKAKSWLADHIKTTSQRWNIWQVWEIPRFAVSSGESGWVDSPLLTCSTCSLKISSFSLLSSYSVSFAWTLFIILLICLFVHLFISQRKIIEYFKADF